MELTDIQQALIDGVNNAFYCPRCGALSEDIVTTPSLATSFCKKCGLLLPNDDFWHSNPSGTLEVRREGKA